MTSPLTSPQEDNSLITRTAIVVLAAYLAVQMISDVASLKIGTIFGLAVDMGTFLYPLTFTLRDMVHKTLGKKAAQTIIVTAAGINLFMALYLMWSASFPSDAFWDSESIPGTSMHAAFAAVLSPMWRIVLASIAAELISELLDTEIFHRVRKAWMKKYGEKRQWMAVLISNSISVPTDNLIFCLGAFAFTNSWEIVWGIFIVNLVTKFAMTLISLPGIYLTPGRREDN